MDVRRKYAIIGAGSSGLAAARNLMAAGIDCAVLERESDLGGNWNIALPCSQVYRSTHLISSKRGTEFPDFPMPDDFPPYPRHDQVLAYLRAYTDEFNLGRLIEHGVAVERIAPLDDGRAWDVALVGGHTRRYDGVVIANGHHWSPRRAEYQGEFHGRIMHSAEYKSPDVLEGRRVLIVGGGNSGCDIAVEAAQAGATVYHSVRRGYYYIPKFLFGFPSDRVGDWMHAMRIPLFARRLITRAVLRIVVGPPGRIGLPAPDHRLFESHPIVNSLLPYYVGQGDIKPKPDIARLDGDGVAFVDGSREAIDLIVLATGYNLEFPFIDRTELNWIDGCPRLHLNVFHPRYDNLFVAGMIQADSGIFGLVHWQMHCVALFLKGLANGHASAQRLRQAKSHPGGAGGGIHYVSSERHRLEIEHWSYRKQLVRLARSLDP